MIEDKAEVETAIYDHRFGSPRHLSRAGNEAADAKHSVKQEAAQLLFDSLDCLHDAIAAQKKGEQIDTASLLALRQRLEGVVRMQRLLRVVKQRAGSNGLESPKWQELYRATYTNDERG